MRPTDHRSRSIWMSLVLLLGQTQLQAAPDDVEALPAKNPANNQFFMNEANLDANIFNPHGNAKQARARLEYKLKLQLEELQRVCDLNEGQRQKLTLAASSDLKKFFDETEAVRQKYRTGKQDQQAWQQIWQDIQPLQMKMSSGLFGEASFFSKTLYKTLTDDQLLKYQMVVGERRRFRYRACIESTMVTMENVVPLRHEQHEKIVNLLLTESPPPSTFGQYDHFLVMYRLAKLPENKVKPLVDANQWKQLQNRLNQARGMEQFLIQQGIITKDEAEEPKAKVRVRRVIRQPDAPADAVHPENRPEKTAS